MIFYLKVFISSSDFLPLSSEGEGKGLHEPIPTPPTKGGHTQAPGRGEAGMQLDGGHFHHPSQPRNCAEGRIIYYSVFTRRKLPFPKSKLGGKKGSYGKG